MCWVVMEQVLLWLCLHTIVVTMPSLNTLISLLSHLLKVLMLASKVLMRKRVWWLTLVSSMACKWKMLSKQWKSISPIRVWVAWKWTTASEMLCLAANAIGANHSLYITRMVCHIWFRKTACHSSCQKCLTSNLPLQASLLLAMLTYGRGTRRITK